MMRPWKINTPAPTGGGNICELLREKDSSSSRATGRIKRGRTTKAKNISGPPSLGNFADHRLPGTEGIWVRSLNSMGKKTTAKRPVPHRRLRTASMWRRSGSTLRGLLLNASSRIVNLAGAATPKQEKCSGSCHAALREHGPPTTTGASQEVPPTTDASTGCELRSARTVRHLAGHRHARCLCSPGQRHRDTNKYTN